MAKRTKRSKPVILALWSALIVAPALVLLLTPVKIPVSGLDANLVCGSALSPLTQSSPTYDKAPGLAYAAKSSTVDEWFFLQRQEAVCDDAVAVRQTYAPVLYLAPIALMTVIRLRGVGSSLLAKCLGVSSILISLMLVALAVFDGPRVVLASCLVVQGLTAYWLIGGRDGIKTIFHSRTKAGVEQGNPG